MFRILLSLLFAALGLCFGFFSPLGKRKDLSVAAVNALCWGACIYLNTSWAKGAVYALAASLLLAVALTDLRTKHIPDRYQFYLFFLDAGVALTDEKGYMMHVYGLLFAAILFAALYAASLLFLRADGIGWGDVKLLIGCGLFLGVLRFCFALAIAVLYAAVESLAVWAFHRVRGERAEVDRAFAPYIAAGVIVAMLW
jgi:leader peptidase (prepilin peptidase)/N-methyltransferase